MNRTDALYQSFLEILREELVPAMGCTEPIAIAYAAAQARAVLGKRPERVRNEVSGNIIKNVKSVTVPNSGGMHGIEAAAVLGAVGGVIAGLGGSNLVPVAIGVALKCLGSSPACYLILAMIAVVIDHIEYRTGIRTDGLTMSIYSSLMVAATPICNSIFSAMLNGSGYNQAADVALGTAAQTAGVQTAISVSYIWVETVCYIIGAVILILFWTVEKNLPEEQKAIKERSKK